MLYRSSSVPPELGPLARQEWDRVVGHLAATGVLSHFRSRSLGIYCAHTAIG